MKAVRRKVKWKEKEMQAERRKEEVGRQRESGKKTERRRRKRAGR